MDNCSVEMALIGVYAALNVFTLATFHMEMEQTFL